jgi:hypothetical protein
MSRKYVAFASATITFTKQTLTGLAASVLISLSHFPVQKFIHFIFVQLPIKIWLLRLLFITAITFSLFLPRWQRVVQFYFTATAAVFALD